MYYQSLLTNHKLVIMDTVEVISVHPSLLTGKLAGYPISEISSS